MTLLRRVPTLPFGQHPRCSSLEVYAEQTAHLWCVTLTKRTCSCGATLRPCWRHTGALAELSPLPEPLAECSGVCGRSGPGGRVGVAAGAARSAEPTRRTPLLHLAGGHAQQAEQQRCCRERTQRQWRRQLERRRCSSGWRRGCSVIQGGRCPGQLVLRVSAACAAVVYANKKSANNKSAGCGPTSA